MSVDPEHIRAYVEYFRDLGVHDFYRRGEPLAALAEEIVVAGEVPGSLGVRGGSGARALSGADGGGAGDSSADGGFAAGALASSPDTLGVSGAGGVAEASWETGIGKLTSFDDLAPLPEVRVGVADRAAALAAIQAEIGDCTRCPLAYAGRRRIVYGDGDGAARLMFVGEGPGADEDASGVPFVGKAGQLLNNMIGAMGLKREQVYIANIVKCRPPANRVPEAVEANTCTQFLLRQMDAVQPQVVVALGSTAATYLLGAKQSLSSLRGRWHTVRGAKLLVTYHPAFLLRDPRQKGEAWKDLQMAMAELGLKAPVKG